MNFAKNRNIVKIVVLSLIIVLVAVFFLTGMQKYLTLEFIKTSGDNFKTLYAENPLMFIALFVAFYILMTALNLPGATVLGLAAGGLFGAVTGTIIISFASSIGATLACLLSRYLLREWVQKKFGERLKRVNEGVRTEGAFYLFSMRLIPVIPFFIINMVMGLTPIRLWTFYWVSQLGMLPGTAIYVNAGSQIAQIDSLGGILSPKVILSFALLGVFPLISRKLLNWYRRRDSNSTVSLLLDANNSKEQYSRINNHSKSIKYRNESSTSADNFDKTCGNADKLIEPSHTILSDLLDQILSCCTDCGVCKKQCGFLQEYGTPKEIFANYDFFRPADQSIAFECSLCNLCTAVCPEKLDPGNIFASVRKEAIKASNTDLSRYNTILNYEKCGSSSLFSYYALPKGCDTVFFPGCTLPGTRPETTWNIFTHLQQICPGLGIVMDCCTKPSHDLGRFDYFESMFGEMRHYLVNSGVKKVVVACPNCYKIFQKYGKGLAVETIYELIASNNIPLDSRTNSGFELAVHDPCPLRKDIDVHNAVRNILSRMGISVFEMKHRQNRTLCCGEGGSSGFIRPDLARQWSNLRKEEADGHKIVTYCAGCAGFLDRVTPTVHIADVIFSNDKALNGGLKVAKSPFTYINRLKLKRRLKLYLKPEIHRVRTFYPESSEK